MSHPRPGREGLEGSYYDVAVIGGGINGVAIARECALAGRRVLLTEKADFASGTTSRATRIIHGGLRYLEHGEIGLVRESLRERSRLLRERPHLVRPLSFVLGLNTHGLIRSALAIRSALWLYTRASRTGADFRSKSTVAQFESVLDSGLNLRLFAYEDAQCEYPERLVAEWLTEATQAGATVRNYTQVLEIGVHEGKVRGLRLRDSMDGSEAEITADWVINATGPWADEILTQSSLERKRLIGGVRGTHIVLPPFVGSPNAALYTEALDGRAMFVIPWAAQMLVGTTEAQQEQPPDFAEPTQEEISYLLAQVQRLYPQAGITSSDIRYSYAGVRPLPYSRNASLGAISRQHILHDHLEDGVAGLITVIGGKLTTAASLARNCARAMGIRLAEPQGALIDCALGHGLEQTFAQWAEMVGKIAGISAASAAGIAAWHGRRALCVARTAALDPILEAPICPHSEHIVAEAVEAVQHESAVTLGDILLRRVPVALGACWSDECDRIAAKRIGAGLGWTEQEQRIQLENFMEERSRFLHPSPSALARGKTRHESLLMKSLC